MLTPCPNYIEWVERRLERPLTDPERELVTVVCTALRQGPWNVHQSWGIMRSGPSYASISVRHDLATYDVDALTRLVFAAHDRCCRVSVGPSGPGRLNIAVNPRAGREGDEYWHRHPTIETALADWRADWPLEAPHA